ncbi:hypothetical protein HPP92_028898, partial [Vanilla planifolia]
LYDNGADVRQAKNLPLSKLSTDQTVMEDDIRRQNYLPAWGFWINFVVLVLERWCLSAKARRSSDG